ncbi:MAG: Coenzyme F420 hydrogenase/dehydrogenase, beta subunit C-terminal domain [Sphingobium sp.]
MTTVAPGFNRPEQIGKIGAEEEKAISGACPGKVVAPWNGNDAPVQDPVWGPAHRIMTGHSTDPDIRFCGSSGGAVSALAFHAITSGLVDHVLQISADPDKPTRNVLRWANTREQIVLGAGSRYAPSSPLEQIDKALEQPGKFAFVGKPCDVSALRQLGKTDPRVNEKVPLMLSFFCAGTPALDGADRIVRAMGLDPENLVYFRYRGQGWPGLTRAVTRDGSVGEMRYAESWGGHLSRQVQFRCKICPDAVGGVADIACADAWYGDERGFPSFEEVDGRSLIMSRTSVGEALLSDAIAKGAIEAAALDIGEIGKMQPAQARRKEALRARLAACTARGMPRPQMDGLAIAEAAQKLSIRMQLKEFLGTWRRAGRRK